MQHCDFDLIYGLSGASLPHVSALANLLIELLEAPEANIHLCN